MECFCFVFFLKLAHDRRGYPIVSNQMGHEHRHEKELLAQLCKVRCIPLQLALRCRSSIFVNSVALLYETRRFFGMSAPTKFYSSSSAWSRRNRRYASVARGASFAISRSTLSIIRLFFRSPCLKHLCTPLSQAKRTNKVVRLEQRVVAQEHALCLRGPWHIARPWHMAHHQQAISRSERIHFLKHVYFWGRPYLKHKHKIGVNVPTKL